MEKNFSPRLFTLQSDRESETRWHECPRTEKAWRREKRREEKSVPGTGITSPVSFFFFFFVEKKQFTRIFAAAFYHFLDLDPPRGRVNFHPFRNGPSLVSSLLEKNADNKSTRFTSNGDTSFRVNRVLGNLWQDFFLLFLRAFLILLVIDVDRRCWNWIDEEARLGALRKVGRNYPITFYLREFLCENNIWLIESVRAMIHRVIIVITEKK